MAKTYKRARVQFNLLYPFVILDPRSPFDSILGWLAAERVLSAGGTEAEATDAVMDLPIRKIQYKDSFFYSSSVADTRGALSQKYYLTKATTLMRYDRAIGDKNEEDIKTVMSKHLLDRVRNTYKPAMVDFKYQNTAIVDYIVDITDEDRFCDFLSGLTNLGKKAAHGFGKLKSGEQKFELFYDVEDIEIKRPMPLDTGKKNAKIEEPYFVTRLLPPYWKKDDGGVLCGIGRY